jgi:hypothetical protein
MVLRRERLKLFEVVSETVTTVTLRSIQSVPAGKPDVQKILSIANVTVSATGTPLPNKVVIEGTATVQTIYVAALPEFHHHTVSRPILKDPKRQWQSHLGFPMTEIVSRW